MILSIITINYNNKTGLVKTIKSVMSQTRRDFEWIIIDGDSTDGSKEIIEELAKNNKSIISYWCSEPDKGIYNAMNKGIFNASGDYVLFLNSGDSFADPNVLSDFSSWICEHHHDIITGDLMINDKSDNIRYAPDSRDLDMGYMCSFSLNHPSSFIKRDLFEKYGYYDETLKIVSDWKWFLYATIVHNCSYTPWRRIVSNFMTDGLSERPENQSLNMSERKSVLDEFLPRVQSYIKRTTSKEYILQTYSLKWFFREKMKMIFQNKRQTVF